MKKLAFALAAAGALALGAPASASLTALETPEAKMTARSAAEIAKADMAATFGAKKLRAGQYLWKAGSDRGSISRVVVSLSDQLAFAYRGDELIGVSTVSSGKKGKETPTGIFPILEKQRTYFSRKYDNAPMPYMQRLDRWGIALHGGQLPGYPASRGCVRLPHQFASKLFSATRVGTPVLIGA